MKKIESEEKIIELKSKFDNKFIKYNEDFDDGSHWNEYIPVPRFICTVKFKLIKKIMHSYTMYKFINY